MKILEAVQAVLRREALLAKGETILVAVSGGADSVFLLHALHRLATPFDITIHVAHLNHLLRGEEADEEERFVRALAERLHLACHTECCDVRQLANATNVSIEMAARDARYALLGRLAEKTGATTVATAHTLDDQAETVLMRLMRGAGTGALGGIPFTSSWRGYRLIRPLLETRKKDIYTWLSDNGVAWREDSSNHSRAYLRNRIRHELMPEMTKICGHAVADNIARTAFNLRNDDEWIETYARNALPSCLSDDGTSLDAAKTAKLHPAVLRRVLLLWMREQNNDITCEQRDMLALQSLILSSQSTGRHQLCSDVVARKAYGNLFIEPSATPRFTQAVMIPGRTRVDAIDVTIDAAIAPQLSRETPSRPGALPARASLQRSGTAVFPLVVRSWQPGDVMRPLGLGGSRKLQDIFVDARIPQHERSRIPIFEAHGEIVWIPGYRVAENWHVTDRTQPALQLRIDHSRPDP